MIAKFSDIPAEANEHMRGGDGVAYFRHWFRKEDFGCTTRLCACVELPIGASIGQHTHNGEDELYLIVSGKGEVQENGEWKPVSAGDAILTGRGASHAIRNSGDEPLVFHAIISTYPQA